MKARRQRRKEGMSYFCPPVESGALQQPRLYLRDCEPGSKGRKEGRKDRKVRKEGKARQEGRKEVKNDRKEGRKQGKEGNKGRKEGK